jgi:hypothetical protein
MGVSNVIQRLGGVAVFAVVVLLGVSIPTATASTTSTLSDATATTLLQENNNNDNDSAERELGTGYRASVHAPMARDNCLSPIQQCAYFDMAAEFEYTNNATNFCPPKPDVAPFDNRVTCVDVKQYCNRELQCGNNGGIFPDCCEQCYQT